MKDPKPFTMFVVQLAQAKAADRERHAYQVAADAEALRTIARSLDAIHTRQCNGYAPTDYGRRLEEKDDSRARKLEAKGATIAERYGLAVYVQRDPRGLPLYLGVAPHMTNRNYSTTGIGVPL